MLKKSKKINILILALAPTGVGISGSDRIFIELARNWSKHTRVEIITSSEGYAMCQRQKLKGKHLSVRNIYQVPKNSSFWSTYIFKILYAIRYALLYKPEKNTKTYIYSSSEFWMDSLPAFIIKLRYLSIHWIATWYQTAPNPLKGFTYGNRENTYQKSAFLYWLVQMPIKPLISLGANFVIVNNELERQQFPLLNRKNKCFVLIGAVRMDEIDRYLLKHPKGSVKKYEAVFQGRFHPQKGVSELIDIWKLVTQKLPSARLAMIGDGPLMGEVKKRIQYLSLKDNIKLYGYVFDGEKKYAIFRQGEVVVHPAYYDSGGMASAEAMAFGLPCVGYDLPAYESYYPNGMIKVPIGDMTSFANEIIRLVQDRKYRIQKGAEAEQMIRLNWSWEKRANELYSAIIKSR